MNAYPLQWPAGWPRTYLPDRSTALFRHNGYPVSMTESLDRVLDELDMMGCENVIVSTDVPVRKDGLPRSDVRYMLDTGAAVYFRIDDRQQVLACDKWDRVQDNIAAVAAHVKAMRGQGRWGVGNIEQAFAGYRALAAVGAVKPWWEILGMTARPQTYEPAKARYRELMITHHPDRGGNINQAAEITSAHQQARKFFGL